MRQWTRSTLVQVMACRLFGAKPLPEPMLPYCQLDPRGQTSVTLESKYGSFYSWNCTWKCHLPKYRTFCRVGWGGVKDIRAMLRTSGPWVVKRRSCHSVHLDRNAGGTFTRTNLPTYFPIWLIREVYLNYDKSFPIFRALLCTDLNVINTNSIHWFHTC